MYIPWSLYDDERQNDRSIMILNSDSSHSDFLKYSDKLLEMGVSIAKHPFHQFSMATKKNDDIEQRTVVLRKWVLKRRTIMFHTDVRSPKVSQIKSNPLCSILFYSNPDKLQLRFKCHAHIHYKNRLSNYMFNQTTSNQRDCYEWQHAPSTKFDYSSKRQFKLHASDPLDAPAIDNFCVCVCNFNDLDLLYLSGKGHIRIKYEWDRLGNFNTYNLVA